MSLHEKPGTIPVDMSGMAGLNAAIAAGVAHRAEQERLMMSLVSALPPHAFETALAEVERRAELFARVRASSLSSGPHPRLAALQSVFDDACMGLLS